MKTLKTSAIAIFGLLLMTLSCKNDKKTETDKPTDQKTKTLTEGERKIVLDNDYAIVTKVTLKPGEAQPEHDGSNRVIYALSDYTIDWKEQGKNLGAKSWRKGDVHYHTAGKHAAVNNGSTTAEWLVFAKKDKALPACGENTVENDVTSVVPNYAKSLFENDDFKITKVVLPKGENIPQHAGVNRIIYSLSDYNLKYQSESTDKIDKTFKKGDVHWHDACLHSLKNDGNSDAEFLVVSYKN